MKKTLITTLLALVLLMLTIYSASAQVLKPIEDKTIEVGIQAQFDITDYINETYEEGWDFSFKAVVEGEEKDVTAQGVFAFLPMFKHGSSVKVDVEVEATNQTNETDTITNTETFNWKIDITGFSMTTINTGDAPRSAVVEREYDFQLEASSNREAAVEEYVYSFVDNEFPDGMTMTSEGKITWTPTTDQFGSHRVKVSAVPKNAPPTVDAVEREFTIEVQGMTIDRVEVRADGSRLETISRTNYLSSSTPYVIDREAELGDEIEMRISVRNNLPDETDNELRDVEIELYSFDLIDADGQDAFISRIRPGRVEDETITFILDPEDLHPDDSPFDLEIRVFGETRGGDLYSDVWYLELRMESQRYALLFRDVTLSPTTVCLGEQIRVTTDLRNIGTRDLSNIGMRYYVSGLDINTMDRNIELDYDDRRTINKFLTIPSDAIPGEYFLELTGYPRATSTSDSTHEVLTFTVRDCEPVDEEEEEETIIVTPPTDDVLVPGTPVTDTVGTPSRSIFDRDNTVYIVLLTVLVVLVLIGVILLFVKVLK